MEFLSSVHWLGASAGLADLWGSVGDDGGREESASGGVPGVCGSGGRGRRAGQAVGPVEGGVWSWGMKGLWARSRKCWRETNRSRQDYARYDGGRGLKPFAR